jgi:hypothetical protein
MAYDTANPPKLLVGAFNRNDGPSLWVYKDADVASDVDAADYFSNGDALGMKVGDFILHYETATPLCHLWAVITVTAGGAATVCGTGNNVDITMA